MEFLENIVQLLLILIALLISLFRYIGSKQRGWLYAVGFFTSSLLSSYFWTAYLVIMGESPNASDLFTYFGWNVSYFILAFLTFHIKTPEERKYFHPLMLLPIPLNIWQLQLYLQFGSTLNNIYQVTVCTIIACSCLQSILWSVKQHENAPKPPFIPAAVLVYVASEFGMWTASCYEGWAEYVYYLFSFLCSGAYLLFLWAIRHHYAVDAREPETRIDRGLQNFLEIAYIGIVAVGSLGGIMLGFWIRDVLTRGAYLTASSDAYAIISVVLFLISSILAAFAIAIIFVVYFEQKIAENNRLREEKQVAERSNAAKSDFLANMSHEIRTPLNAVLGMNKMIILEIQGACEHPPANRDAACSVMKHITEYAGNIENAGNNLLSIINDILDFSKIEAGKLDIVEHPYLLSSVLNDVSTIVLVRAKDKGLALHTEIDGSIPDQLFGDDMRIRQIISNILNNAVKYTDSGSVTLSVHGTGRYQAGETAELAIAVRDTGIGIRKEELSRIFDKFERSDLERNSTVEGTGLGLAITHRLLDMMGGSIHVESEYGKGSVFTVLLPQKVVSTEPIGDFRAKFEQSLASQHTSECLFRAPGTRILIVDDTRMNLSVAAGLLKDTEMQIDLAESGAAALQLCAQNRYDVILLDQRMPVMDGTETLRRLRAQEHDEFRQVPVICLTADALTGAKEHYIAEGFTDYLSKPIDSLSMKRLLMQYLPAEKILPPVETTPVRDPEPPAPDGLLQALQQKGIHTEAAMDYCQNDRELYRMLLEEFVQGAPKKQCDLQRFYDKHDANNYAILIHALKSSSRMIGAEALSAIAAGLEKAADADDWDTLTAEHPEMLTEYDALLAELNAAIGYVQQPVSVSVSADGEDEIMEFFPEDGNA